MVELSIHSPSLSFGRDALFHYEDYQNNKKGGLTRLE
jgi:hypothetical protein